MAKKNLTRHRNIPLDAESQEWVDSVPVMRGHVVASPPSWWTAQWAPRSLQSDSRCLPSVQPASEKVNGNEHCKWQKKIERKTKTYLGMSRVRYGLVMSSPQWPMVQAVPWSITNKMKMFNAFGQKKRNNENIPLDEESLGWREHPAAEP